MESEDRKATTPGRWMREALRLARRGTGTTSPNPMVGAVVVRGGRVVGRGFHRKAGEPHAEILALDEAGERARGSALYVTLEPCCHRGRTGPCTERIIGAGIRRLIAPHADPFPEVAGRGFRKLRAAGITVEVGEGAREALILNEAYLMRIAEGRPWVDLKMAMTLDGKVADAGGASRWITGEKARRRGHELRWEADAILAGVGTVLADDPLLTARRGAKVREPIRVIVDGCLRTPPSARLLVEGDPARVRIATLAGTPAPRRARLESAGATVWSFAARRRREVPLEPLLRRLAREGVNRVLVEGGPRVAGSFLRGELVDRLHLFVAPKALGEGASVFKGLGALSLASASSFAIEGTARLGEDLEIRLRRRE